MSWVRRCLRMNKMVKWKGWKALHNAIKSKDSFEKISMRRWRNANCHLIHIAHPNEWFVERELYDMERVKTDILHQYHGSR